MRRDVQEIFRNTPHEKQVMMFSATLSKEIRPVCKKFMQDVISPFSTWPFSNGNDGSSSSCTIICGRLLGVYLEQIVPLICSRKKLSRGRSGG